ncbi:hypothetical protein DER46DRAFT_652403 [Fusarium sp. MPI-SDFR-AT-0072]|uniref:CBM-cenC domain-containing protein n=1 Tax=Fusarium oxysporum f. sp. rapae TaxID=485398 RepID=A0A8J5PCG2_FUSOX|nr:hypothetical protein Forpe1208_v000030 [Fusarium oxysporum f. sp. rapae]KAH7180228.1 hypothetical protein DER46DRAFT_652403 [Fusarium sp. MPI-SDFR-AT-0072]
MRFIRPILQLLALCSTTFASPCKPSALIKSTEDPSLSTTQLSNIPESSTATESLGEPPNFTTESTPAFEATTTSGLLSISTTSAEPSTTTSDLPQQPSNLLRNPGFEDSTVAPWERSVAVGDPTISTSEAHGGSQSGFISGAPGGPADIGFRQRLDSSLFEADKPYTFSVYVKTTVAGSCFTRMVTCDSGTGSQTAYFNSANIQGPLNEWVLATVTCSWSQARLESGISVAVRGVCEHLSFFIDDAVVEAAE